MSGYCPAGKCECIQYRDGVFDVGWCFVLNLFVSKFEVCPCPSRQVPVEPDIAKEIADMPDEEFKLNCEKIKAMCDAGKENYLREQYIAWFAAGRAEGIREARELIADDAYAITFQTMCQYRSALIKALEVKP